MGELKGGVKKNIYTIQGCIYKYAKVLTLECCRKNLMNQPIAIYTIDKLKNSFILLNRLDLSWSQNFASLQTGEICMSMVKKKTV